MATDVFAGLPVDDFETARAWYRLFVGRAPDVIPKPDEAVWRLAGTGWIYVVADGARAGSAIVTLLVDDLTITLGQSLAEHEPTRGRELTRCCREPPRTRVRSGAVGARTEADLYGSPIVCRRVRI